jgi:hypothetical protein
MIRSARRAGGRFLAVVLVAVGLLASLGSVPAHAASATPQGCPGRVQVPKFHGYHYSNPPMDIAVFPERFAYRSACYANSTQTIYARYRSFRWNVNTQTWVLNGEHWVPPARVAPGQLGAWLPSHSPFASRFLTVDVQVQWWTGSTFIGSVYIDYNSVGDYTCSLCSVHPDPNVGAYIAFY